MRADLRECVRVCMQRFLWSIKRENGGYIGLLPAGLGASVESVALEREEWFPRKKRQS